MANAYFVHLASFIFGRLPHIYRILSKNLSQAVARKICHLVTIRIGMSKMAESDEYLDYHDKTLERTEKPWSAS